MANIDAPFGLRPIAKLGSAPGGTTGTTKYKISSGASALFTCLLYTSPSPRDRQKSRMPSSA